MLNNKVYDVFKFVAQYVLPALATLYFAVSGIWGLPNTEEVVGTIMLIDVFLGALLGVSTYNYNKERSLVTRATQPELFTLEGGDGKNLGNFFSEDVYNVLYWVAQILLPALGSLYFGLAKLWGFPYGQEILGTISAIDAFLGVMLGISMAQFKNQLPKTTPDIY